MKVIPFSSSFVSDLLLKYDNYSAGSSVIRYSHNDKAVRLTFGKKKQE